MPRPEAWKRGMARPEAWERGMARLKPWKRGVAGLEPWEGGVGRRPTLSLPWLKPSHPSLPCLKPGHGPLPCFGPGHPSLPCFRPRHPSVRAKISGHFLNNLRTLLIISAHVLIMLGRFFDIFWIMFGEFSENLDNFRTFFDFFQGCPRSV